MEALQLNIFSYSCLLIEIWILGYLLIPRKIKLVKAIYEDVLVFFGLSSKVEEF